MIGAFWRPHHHIPREYSHNIYFLLNIDIEATTTGRAICRRCENYKVNKKRNRTPNIPEIFRLMNHNGGLWSCWCKKIYKNRRKNIEWIKQRKTQKNTQTEKMITQYYNALIHRVAWRARKMAFFLFLRCERLRCDCFCASAHALIFFLPAVWFAIAEYGKPHGTTILLYIQDAFNWYRPEAQQRICFSIDCTSQFHFSSPSGLS